MALVGCILGKFLVVVCHSFPLKLLYQRKFIFIENKNGINFSYKNLNCRLYHLHAVLFQRQSERTNFHVYTLAELSEEYGLSIIREWDADEDVGACEGRGNRVWKRL